MSRTLSALLIFALSVALAVPTAAQRPDDPGFLTVDVGIDAEVGCPCIAADELTRCFGHGKSAPDALLSVSAHQFFATMGVNGDSVRQLSCTDCKEKFTGFGSATLETAVNRAFAGVLAARHTLCMFPVLERR